MGLELVEYEQGDVYRVKIRLGDPLGGSVTDLKQPAWTLLDEEGNALLCFSILPEGTSGIATFFAYVSDDARGHGHYMLKTGRRIVERSFKHLNLHRIQAIVRADKVEYQRWIELLGFEKEGLMRKAAANKSDVWLYSRVSED